MISTTRRTTLSGPWENKNQGYNGNLEMESSIHVLVRWHCSSLCDCCFVHCTSTSFSIVHCDQASKQQKERVLYHLLWGMMIMTMPSGTLMMVYCFGNCVSFVGWLVVMVERISINIFWPHVVGKRHVGKKNNQLPADTIPKWCGWCRAVMTDQASSEVIPPCYVPWSYPNREQCRPRSNCLALLR